MKASAIEKMVTGYGLAFSHVSPVKKGYRNESYRVTLKDGSFVNLMLFKTEPAIKDRIIRTNNVSNFVNLNGLPSRKTLSSRILILKGFNFKKYGAIYNYLPGNTINWEAYSKAHIKLLGMTLGKTHGILKGYSGKLPDVAHEYLNVNKEMNNYFTDSGVKNATLAKLGLIIKADVLSKQSLLLKSSSELPNKQPLHMDFVRGNILFENNNGSKFSLGKVSISGVLDFEKTSYGHAVFDVARTLAFLLVDCKYKTSEKIYKYFLISGYLKRGNPLFTKPIIIYDTERVDVLEELINMFLFYDFYKFLKHNPYEFLNKNEHFMRTRDLLIERQLLMLK